MKEAAPTLVTEELLERRIAAIDTLHIELTRITEELFLDQSLETEHLLNGAGECKR